MKGKGLRHFSILLFCALAADFGNARSICREGLYSSMGEAKQSGDMFGSTLIVVDQTPELTEFSLDRQKTGTRKKVTTAHGIFFCTGEMDVRSDLVSLEIRYPKFTFELNEHHACFPSNLKSTAKRPLLAATGDFTDKGVWLTLAGQKEFLPRKRDYCATSEKSAGK
jgi:hypothetical protein